MERTTASSIGAPDSDELLMCVSAVEWFKLLTRKLVVLANLQMQLTRYWACVLACYLVLSGAYDLKPHPRSVISIHDTMNDMWLAMQMCVSFLVLLLIMPASSERRTSRDGGRRQR